MNDKMLQEVKDFMTPFGTVGQLIEETPKEVISKVFEDLLYQTGHHGRTVLIGDGKMQVMMAYMQNFFLDVFIKERTLISILPHYTDVAGQKQRVAAHKVSLNNQGWDVSKNDMVTNVRCRGLVSHAIFTAPPVHHRSRGG